MDDSGKIVAHYDYDAYGNQRIYGYHNDEWLLLEDTLTHEGVYANSTMPIQLPYLLGNIDTLKLNHIAYINPFRYRSYYYDIETNLYYLTSRYYGPETGRFINADDISYADPETINGLNLFAYCSNNPIANIDPTGNSPKWWQWLLFGIGAALVIAATVVVSLATFGTGTAFTGIGGAILLGAAKGALIGAAVGSTIGIAGGAIYAGVTGANMGDSILQGFLMGLGIGAIAGALVGGSLGGLSFSNAGKAWKGGSKAMVSHYKKTWNEYGL